MADLLSKIQVWKIAEPYQFSEEEAEYLTEHPLSKAKNWYDNDYKPIKDNIRDYYKTAQNNTCCYCRLPLHGGAGNIEIEHIIDKNRRLDFVFEPKNLVVSCHNCNFNKSTKAVMAVCPTPNDYPIDGENFNIVHGHFHDYFEHVEFRASSAYHALTDRGETTINLCKLARLGLAEQREEVTMYQDDPIILDVINIRNSGNDPSKIDELIAKLKELKRSD